MKPEMRSKYGWEFIVKPKTLAGARFPIDMLRYDRCYPASSKDASEITARIHYNTGGKGDQVTLRTTKGTLTKGRWESFGWQIKEGYQLTKEGIPESRPSLEFSTRL
jgi:hypothetical protein